MEIKFLNVSCKIGRKTLLKNINLYINDALITGIYLDDYKIIPNIITGNVAYQGKVLFDNQELKKNSKTKKTNSIPNFSYIKELDCETFLTDTVSSEFFLAKKDIDTNDLNYIDKIISSLKMVGLNEFFLKRKINTLSKSEKRLLEIAIKLITNPDFIIIDEPFLYLNKNQKFNIKKILLDLRKKYHKTIIILSNDINVLYELTDELIILKENKVLVQDKTKLIFKDLEFLEKNQIMLPNIVLFRKIALNYDKKLENYKEVNDLIKGVYKIATGVKEDA